MPSAVLWQCFPVMRSTKAYHEDDSPHNIPKVRYSFLVTQYPVPQARNSGFKSSVVHWDFSEIKLGSFLTRLSCQKSLQILHTNNECFYRLIHHCKQGLDSSVNLFPMNNLICLELKDLNALFFSAIECFSLMPSQLGGTCNANKTTTSHIANAQLNIKVVAFLYVFPNPI